MIYFISNKTFEGIASLHLLKAIQQLDELDSIACDTETTGLDFIQDRLITIQLGNAENQYVFDIEMYGGTIPPALKYWLNNTNKVFLLHNAKFDLKFFMRQGVFFKTTQIYDTMLAEKVLYNGLKQQGFGLAELSRIYCGVQLDKSVREDILSNKGLTYTIVVYAARDVEYLHCIQQVQLKRAEEYQMLNCVQLENMFVVSLAYMEYCGIKLDWTAWTEKYTKDTNTMNEALLELNQYIIDKNLTKYLSGMCDLFNGTREVTINWSSPKQVIELFKELGIPTTVKEKGQSKESIDAKHLEPIKDSFEILGPYLKYKGYEKLVGTYGENWRAYINPVTGRIHPSFTQMVNTGRMSCGERPNGTYPGSPNLQNLPSDSATRHCFVAELGNKITACDYSAQEARVLANFSQEPGLLNFYAKGLDDMHSYVALLMYPEIRPCSLEEVTNETLTWVKKNHKDKRQLAKSAGFAIAYGGNGATISKNCNISKEQGEFVYNSYFKSFPKLKEYFNYKLQESIHNGYILYNDIDGRKYFIPQSDPIIVYKGMDPEEFPNPWAVKRELNKATSQLQRNSQNYPIQGSSASITKLALIIFYNELVKQDSLEKVKLINVVHDRILSWVN